MTLINSRYCGCSLLQTSSDGPEGVHFNKSLLYGFQKVRVVYDEGYIKDRPRPQIFILGFAI